MAGGPALAVDIGTSSLKAALVSPSGELLGSARVPLPAASLDARNFRPAMWTDAFVAALAALDRPGRAASVAVSGNGPTLVLLDRAGRELGALFWHDGRSRPVEGSLSLFLPRLRWLREEDPALLDRVASVLPCPEYLSWLLCGEKAAFLPQRGYEPFYWGGPGESAGWLDSAILPPYALSGERLGTLSREAASRFGLRAGIPVAAGGPDFSMALIGTGTMGEGMTLDRAGTSEGINHCARDRLPREGIRFLPHPAPGLWNAAVLLPASGRYFEWYLELTSQAGCDYEAVLGAIRALPPREDLFFVPRGAGMGHGAPSSFLIEGSFPSRAEMGRAVVEAIGFHVRAAVELLEAAGYPVGEIRVSGGQAKSPSWNAMKADIIGRPLLVPSIRDGELAGAACAAFVASGEYPSIEAASRGIVRMEGLAEPDPRRSARFEARYRKFVELLEKEE